MSKRKNGFTLVELLAVIVILAVILVIAVPQIMNIITESRKGTLMSSTKLIAASAESAKLSNDTLGINKTITCSDVSKLNSEDYESCAITFDESGKAKVTLVGKGKFEGITCIGSKGEVTCGESANNNYPTMVAGSAWYKSEMHSANIEVVEFINSYTPTGNELDSWNVDVDDTGSIKAYIVASGYVLDDLLASGIVDSTDEKEVKVIIAGDGSGKILANTDLSYMFKDLRGLTKIEGLNIFDTSNVTDMSYMFYSSGNNATILNLSNFDTSNVTNMSEMFAYIVATTLDLSSFDTSNVTDMSGMFSGSSVPTLDLSSFNTSNVLDMSSMFDVSRITSIDLTGFNTSNVLDMSSMFYDCSATTLDLSSFDTSNVTDMSHMFSFSFATTGYARTQEEADKFNGLSGKPNALTFVVKP